MAKYTIRQGLEQRSRRIGRDRKEEKFLNN